MTIVQESKLLADEMVGYVQGLPESAKPRMHLTIHTDTERDFFSVVDSLGGPGRFRAFENYLALENKSSPLMVTVYPPHPYGVRAPRHELVGKVEEMRENIEAAEAELEDVRPTGDDPGRRVVSAWAWGIDCGSLRLGLGMVEIASGQVNTELVEWRTGTMDPAVSLERCYQTCSLAFDHLAARYPPATVAFEMPTGRHRNPGLMLHTGVIVLAARQATHMSPWRTAVAQWKKVVTGSGKMTKDALPAWGRTIGLRPERLKGGLDYDQLAAAAVAASAASVIGGLDLSLLHTGG